MFHAYPKGAGQGDYHCQIRMEEPPRRVGDRGEDVYFVCRATPTGDRKLRRFELVVWPLHAKDVIRFKDDGHPPGSPEPLRHVSVDKPIPGSEAFGLGVRFPASKLVGFDQIGVSSFVLFEDGWVTIVDSAVLAPSEGAVAPVSSR